MSARTDTSRSRPGFLRRVRNRVSPGKGRPHEGELLRDASGAVIAWPAPASVVLQAIRAGSHPVVVIDPIRTRPLEKPLLKPGSSFPREAGWQNALAAPALAPLEPDVVEAEIVQLAPVTANPRPVEASIDIPQTADPARRELVGAFAISARSTATVTERLELRAPRATPTILDSSTLVESELQREATIAAHSRRFRSETRPPADSSSKPAKRGIAVSGQLGEAGPHGRARSAAAGSTPRTVTMGKITSVRAVPIAIPLAVPTRISTRTIAHREFVLVRVGAEGSDAIGTGYSYAGTSGGALLANAVNQLLAPSLVGRESTDIVGAYEALYQETLLSGRRGAVLRAISAIDIALWDLLGKVLGVPVAVLLGGAARPVKAYASGGYYRPDDGPWEKAVAREIESNVAAGFVDHKIKVGGLSVADDALRVHAAIGALGDGGRLAVDANNAYRSAPEALAAIRAFERAAGDSGLWWMEEPLSPDDVDGHAELARIVETPIATGEIAQTRHDFRQLLDQRGADILQPDAAVLGGITEWIRVARAAEVHGIPVAPHWHANLHVHLAAASPNCVAIEHFSLEKDIYNFEQLLVPDSRLLPADGYITVPNRPGLGIELDLAAVRRFALAP